MKLDISLPNNNRDTLIKKTSEKSNKLSNNNGHDNFEQEFFSIDTINNLDQFALREYVLSNAMSDRPHYNRNPIDMKA